MKKTTQKTLHRTRRHNRIRARISGTAARPRLSVFRSNRYIGVQLIDDVRGATLAQANDVAAKSGNKVARAQAVGKAIADAAKAKNITSVVFDRGGFLYAGRVKALADAAREAGLNF